MNEKPAAKTAAELLREVAAADPEGHNARLGRAYGVGPPTPEAATEQDDVMNCGCQGMCPEHNPLTPPVPSGLQRATEQQPKPNARLFLDGKPVDEVLRPGHSITEAADLSDEQVVVTPDDDAIAEAVRRAAVQPCECWDYPDCAHGATELQRATEQQ